MDISKDRPIPQPAARTYKLGRAGFLALTGGTAVALAASVKGFSVSVPKLNFVPGGASANGFTIYTVTSGYPPFQANAYRLKIGGMVNKPLTMTIDEVLAHPAVTERRFYQCVTGWKVPDATWTGTRLSELLDRVLEVVGAALGQRE